MLALDETTLRGTFALQGFDAPAYRFALDVDAVDADRYLPPKARDAEAGEATAGDIELPQNNTMNLDGTMQVGSLKLAGMQFADVGSRIVIGGGDLTLENARANLYGGTFAGNFRMRAAGDDPGLALDGRASGIALEPLIAALTGEEPNFSGTGSFDLNLAGKGRTVIQNVQTAGGNVSFDMLRRRDQGLQLRQDVVRRVQRHATRAGAARAAGADGVRIHQGLGRRRGRHRDEQRHARAHVVHGHQRRRNVGARRADARLRARRQADGLDRDSELRDARWVRRRRGAVSRSAAPSRRPSIMPDFSKLVRQQLRDAIEDRIQDRLRDLLR